MNARGDELRTKAPKLIEYLDTIHARPAYKAALEKGGKFELLTG